MADRYPLIVDSLTGTIKELPSGDNLDLGGGALTNATVTGGVDVTGVTTTTSLKITGSGSLLNPTVAIATATGFYDVLPSGATTSIVVTANGYEAMRITAMGATDNNTTTGFSSYFGTPPLGPTGLPNQYSYIGNRFPQTGDSGISTLGPNIRIGIGTANPLNALQVQGGVFIGDARWPSAIYGHTLGYYEPNNDSSGFGTYFPGPGAANGQLCIAGRNSGLLMLDRINGVSGSSSYATAVSIARMDRTGGTGILNSGIGSETALQTGSTIGNFSFIGSKGPSGTHRMNYGEAARMLVGPDSNWSDTSCPGYWGVEVCGAGSTFPSLTLGTNGMKLNSEGELLIGYTSDNGAYKLQVNSQIFATSATVATSDGNYKENVNELTGGLEIVKNLRPVSFTWKEQEDVVYEEMEDTHEFIDGVETEVRKMVSKTGRVAHNFPKGTQIGFIAQEVEEVLDGKDYLNSVIKENKRAAVVNRAGEEIAPEEQFLGIAEGNMIAILTSALKEAVDKIEDLEARLAAAGL